MNRKQKRLSIIAGGAIFLAAAAGLVMSALSDQIVFFSSPTDIHTKQVSPDTRIRLGGLVEEGTVVRGEGAKVTFEVTDTNDSVKVTYSGILPDLFREGQGVVAEGIYDPASRIFTADTILAKHDENYMPKEVADALKAQGVWQEGEGGPQPAAATN